MVTVTGDSVGTFIMGPTDSLAVTIVDPVTGDALRVSITTTLRRHDDLVAEQRARTRYPLNDPGDW
jgi:hypothetical protein